MTSFFCVTLFLCSDSMFLLRSRPSWHALLRVCRDVIPSFVVYLFGRCRVFVVERLRTFCVSVFSRVADEFMDFIRGAELIIHNAPFDVGFIDAELKLLDADARLVASEGKITDSLQLARAKHPGQRNNLDALCQRYAVDNSNRTLHGALLDAEILADVYLLMTGGQTTLGLSANNDSTRSAEGSAVTIRRLPTDTPKLRVISATEDETRAHEARLDKLSAISENGAVWRR